MSRLLKNVDSKIARNPNNINELSYMRALLIEAKRVEGKCSRVTYDLIEKVGVSL